MSGVKKRTNSSGCSVYRYEYDYRNYNFNFDDHYYELLYRKAS